MTEKQRDELLLNMSSQLEKHDELLLNMSSQLEKHDELLLNMSSQIKEQNEHLKKHDELLLNMYNKMKKHDDLFEKVFDEIKEVKEEQRNLSRTVAKIEVEHGEKLQILLDVATGQEQKNKEFEKRFEDNERILQRHSDKIYYLELKENKIKPIL